MPEGPELHIASRFINHMCKGRVFGKVLKSEISKNPNVNPPAEKYIISSSSRGKEIKITLTETTNADGDKKLSKSQTNTLDILFTFGLAGKFDFHEANELQKHAHLNFFTCDSQPASVLSFIDYMRFGKWTPGADFSVKDRGPCVLFDYSNFRNNVLQNLNASAFNKPICEVLLNQKYFNGIGNYLRAEILHRMKIPPFVQARSVLEPLAECADDIKSEEPDILQLCHILPHEVIALESSWYDGKDRSDESNTFNTWLQCYYQDGMKNIADHNKRTIWYSGPLGPMAPVDGKVRARKSSKKKPSDSEDDKNQTKKTSTKRKKKDIAGDTLKEETLPSENKRAKRAKSVQLKLEKEQKLENVDSKEENNDETKMKPKTKVRKAGSGKQKEEDSVGIAKLTDDLKPNLQNGRLTRGKIKQIVDEIENMSEKKIRQKRKPIVKQEKMTIKSEKDELGADLDEDNKLQKDHYHDNIAPVNGKVKVEQVNIGEVETNVKLVLSARTKLKARAGKSDKNGEDNGHNGRGRQKDKLKTPRKKPLKRLSHTKR
ncbi:endonuclease 8-like 1 [Ruditapes philippinarum]|uniref:endonuclease 8-like 1 n=1 Tax=Ruditapes philippinarum TaxID=129788 RepID=UPI00295C0E52|nr:endonuclease 8-like 1 [Ruditapes philippinarum]